MVEDNKNDIIPVGGEGCTCLDEYITTFCPVHPPISVGSTVKPLQYGETDKIIITDNDMSEVGYGRFEGYIFNCPSCGEAAIMVNPTMGKFCTNCGIGVEIRSKTITAKIRSLANKGE